MTVLFTGVSPPTSDEKTIPIISVDNVTVGYGEEIILRNVSFEVHHGEVLAVLGRSGCGKSTLFKSMIGLVEPLSGEIRIAGERVQSLEENLTYGLLRKIGVLFQSGALFSSLTLAENVAFPLRQHTALAERNIEQIVALKLSQVGLAGREKYLPSELSGGMQKRAALARAMALDPEILFFDEPSAGLDPVTSAELDLTIQSISDMLGTTIVMVTHELASILTIADQVILLDSREKTIIARGKPAELRDSSSDTRVRAFFSRSPEGDDQML